jgi:hypothetical protein
MNQKVPFALVCVAALAFACGPRSRGESAATRSGSRATAGATTDPRTPLTHSLDVTVDHEVRFEFRVTNASSAKLEVQFPDGRTHELVVLDSIGREVWRWSEGRLFTQAMQNRVLRASDAIAFDGSWDDATPGRYTAVATLASANFPVEERTEFVVR